MSINIIFMLFCSFLLFAAIDGTFDFTLEEEEEEHGIISKRRGPSLPQERRGNGTIDRCVQILVDNRAPYCNLTELAGEMLKILIPLLSDDHFDHLNTAYSTLCSPECLVAFDAYFDCRNLSLARRKYWKNYLLKGRCGQEENGDYCAVVLLKSYKHNIAAYKQLLNSTCPFSTSEGGILCQDASEECLNGLSTFTERMGCCAEPYLGANVYTCPGISVKEPCAGIQEATTSSGVGAMAHSAAVAIFMIIGLLFM